MDELVSKIAVVEKKISELKKQARDAYAEANADKTISPDEKRKITQIAQKIKRMQERLQTIKGELSSVPNQPVNQEVPKGTTKKSTPEPRATNSDAPAQSQQGSAYGDTPERSSAGRYSIEWQAEQAEGKERFDPLQKQFDAMLKDARSRPYPSEPIGWQIGLVSRVLNSAESEAHDGRFVLAASILEKAERDRTELIKLLDDPDRLNFLNLSIRLTLALVARIPECLDIFSSDLEALEDQHKAMMNTAQTGKYAAAIEESYALGAGIDALDLKLSDQKRYDEVMAHLRSLEPGLSDAKIIKPGEEGYESLQFLRQMITDYESEIIRLANAAQFDEALKQVSYLSDEIVNLADEIAAKESANLKKSDMPPGPISFETVAAQCNIDPGALWALNPDLQTLRGSIDKVEPGDLIFLPDPELHIESFKHEGKLLVLTRKKRIELEALVSAKIGRKVEAKITPQLETYRRLEAVTSKNNATFWGSIVCIFARTDNGEVADEYFAAENARQKFLAAVTQSNLKEVEALAERYQYLVRVYGRALYEWREDLYGGARSAISFVKFVRDATFTVAATLAAGPVVKGLELTWKGAMVVNGVSNSAFGVLRQIDDTAIDLVAGEDVDWSNVAKATSMNAVVDFVTGAAADALMSGVRGVLGKWLSMQKTTIKSAISRPGSPLHQAFEVAAHATELKNTKGTLIDAAMSWLAGQSANTTGLPIDAHWEILVRHAVGSDRSTPVTLLEFETLLSEAALELAPEIIDELTMQFIASPECAALLEPQE